MRFAREMSSNLIGTGLTFGLGTVNQVLLARALGAEGRAELGLVVTSVTFAGLLLGEWLSRGNTFVTGSEPGRGRQVSFNTVLYGTGIAALLVGAATLVSKMALPFDLGVSPALYYAVAGITALTVLQKAGQAIVLGEDRLHLYAFLPVVLIAVWLAGNGLALLVWETGLGGVLNAWLVAASVAAAASIAPVWKGRARFDRALFARTAAVGGRGAASYILIFLLFRSDVYLVFLLLDKASLGIYMIAVVLAEMMQRIPNIAGAVMLPKVIRGHDEGHALSLAVARRVLLYSALVGVGVVVVGQPVIEFAFSSEFSGAYEPLVWMLPGLVASGFGSVLNTRLAGQGYPPVTIWAPAIALVVNAALNLLLIPSMALRGAALATSVAYILWAAIVTQRYRCESGVRWREFLRVTDSGADIGMDR